MALRRDFGNIEQLKSGRYRARFINPNQPHKNDGTRNWVNAPTTFTTKTAARSWLTQVKADIERGVWKSPEQLDRERREAEQQAKKDAYTFGEFAQRWIDSRELRPTTKHKYDSLLDLHILPTFKHMPIRSITRADVRAWLEVVAPGRPRTRKSAADLLGTIFRSAVLFEVVDVSPYVAGMFQEVRPPKPPKGMKVQTRPRQALTLKQLDDLANTVAPYLSVLVRLSGLVGLRSGEARALRASDVEVLTTNPKGEPTSMAIHVRRNVTGEGSALRFGEPKTAAGIRSFIVPPVLIPELWKLVQETRPNGLLFHSVGKPSTVIPDTTYRHCVERAAESLGLGKVHPHDLRRTAITAMSEQQIPPHISQTISGHTDEAMQERYRLANLDGLNAAALVISRAYEERDKVASLDVKRREHENQNNTTSQQAK
ncbi:tyrosine-type recombinase/integrase [Arcanobacterium phocae]|uniref:tyrosine-type recombinase/integrase n=1 Tax=Arcanobacterium phocae TaxID=131112 RepID=UPI001C0F381B|nr:site-specific integrase [Arcanobacterium phocae]